MITCPVQAAAVNFGHQDFILQQNETLTFAGFEYNVRSACRILEAKGVQRGEKIFVGVKKNWQSLALIFAGMRLGCIVIPLDSQLPRKRVQTLIDDFAVQHTIVADNWLLDFALGGQTSVDETQACLGIFTSGSHAAPKLVVHSYESLLSNAYGSNQVITLTPGDRTLLSLPLYHIGGFSQVVRALISGSALVIDGAVEDPDVLKYYEITHASMVATQLRRLVLRQPSLPGIKAILVGGGPCPTDLIQEAEALGYPLWFTYGLTETASQILTLSPQGKQFVLAGMQLKLGEQNEILVRGNNLFLGYWGRQGINSSRDNDGWFHTRDLGRKIGDRIVIEGRLDNQFTSGGKNIQPEEIEKHIQALSGIDSVVVVPVSHGDFGQTPFAFVRLLEGRVDDNFIETTINVLKAELPGYLVPRFYAELPRDAGLKPRRGVLTQLAEQYITNQD